VLSHSAIFKSSDHTHDGEHEEPEKEQDEEGAADHWDERNRSEQ
jgi:hypothetical protein